MDTIRPSADLRNHYNDIASFCRENKEPVTITVNGRGDTVIMGIAQYQQMKAELELLRILAESEEDVRMGRVAPIEQTFESMRRMLDQLEEEIG